MNRPVVRLTRCAHAAALGILLWSSATYGQEKTPDVYVATASEDADGYTEAVMDQALLQLLERHAVDGITRKANIALSAQGITAKFPPLHPSSTYTTIGGKKLAIVKLRNDYANQVVIHGIVGKEFRRVVCAKSRNFQTDVPVFYGECGDAVRTTFGIKGLPEALKLK